MFYYLSGTVALKEANLAVIDCGGVGFSCQVTAYTLSSLTLGKQATLFTYLNVKEDALDLFGFSEKDELSLFKKLLSVSGVGPKAALSILSANTPANLALAIITENEAALTAASGIGKKIAQRVILELKDKLAKDGAFTPSETYAGANTLIPEDKRAEAIAALAVLGYQQSEIIPALRELDLDALSLEEIIKLVLKKMMKQ